MRLSLDTVARPRASSSNASAAFVLSAPISRLTERPDSPEDGCEATGRHHADRARGVHFSVPVTGAGPAVVPIACLKQLPERPPVDHTTGLHDEDLIPVVEPKHFGHAAEFPDVRNRMECVRRDEVGKDLAECVVTTDDVNDVKAEPVCDEHQPAAGRYAKNRCKAASILRNDDGCFDHTMNTKGGGHGSQGNTGLSAGSIPPSWLSAGRVSSAFLQGLLLEFHLLEEAFVGFLFYDAGKTIPVVSHDAHTVYRHVPDL